MESARKDKVNLLDHRAGRVALFTLLYASEGGPIGFIWWALPTILRSQGVAVDRITGLTAVLVIPWTFKFMWAPLVDWLRVPGWGFKAWIGTAQTLMGLTLIPLMWLDPVKEFAWWRLLLLAHAFSAATQDVAIDALAINVVPAHQRGTVNGCMQAGMLLGRSLFGGGALLLLSRAGRPAIILGLLICIMTSLLLLLFVDEHAESIPPRKRLALIGARLRSALRGRGTWLGLGFALISASAFEATGALAGPFLIDRGESADAVGWFFALPVVLATLIGGLIGGRLSDVWGRTRTVGLFLCGFVAVILLLAAADGYGAESRPVLLTLLTAMYFFIGLFTAASYALFMDLTDPALGATQFSAFMAATNGCESWSGWAGGRMAAGAGYSTAFVVTSAVSLLSLPILWMLGRFRRRSLRRSSVEFSG
jgi:MFS transporter, PAT family, beta-lactamase induction signal transducer AmpG